MTGDSVIKPFSRVATPPRPRYGNGHVVVLETDLVPLDLTRSEPDPTPTPTPVTRRTIVWLSVAQCLLALALIWIELAQPAPQRGLTGIIFSNAIASSGGKAALHLYRDTLDWLPFVGDSHVLSPRPYIYSRRIIFVLMALVQLGALWTVSKERRPSLSRWLIGPAISMALFLLYPPINTDVFYYASAGEVGNRGGNPYLVSPQAFRADTFDRFSDWEHITVPYGPAWTLISRAIVFVTGTDPFWTSFGFKVVLGVAALVLALVTARLARVLTGDPRREVLAFILVAWSPILAYESAGTAHLDPLLMVPALLGLLLIISPSPHRMRGGLLLIALSALFKPVTVPLLGSAALLRLARRRTPMREIVRQWGIDIAAVLALVVIAFAPYWAGGKLPGAMWDNQRSLYVESPLRANPFWIWLMPRLGVSGGWLPIDGSKIAQSAAILLGAGAVFWLVRREVKLRKHQSLPDPTPPMLLRWEVQTWAIVMFALGYIPPNSHSWYMLWAIPLVALIAVDRIRFDADVATAPVDGRTNGHAAESRLAIRSIPWPIALYFIWTFINFFVYHTWARG